ncbi:MAG: glycosyltransferase family 2 protein, partial [Hymenobacter sp.]
MQPAEEAAARPRVSVIIPNYNHARYLPQRIESVLGQSVRELEVILLDDCSPDASRQVIAQYASQDARIRVVLNEQNSGSTFKQWNKGFALARGEYVWVAESDDFAEPDLLARLLAPLVADPAVSLAYCNSFDVDEQGTVSGTWEGFLTELDPMWQHDFVVEGLPLVRRFLSFRNFIPNASAVLMRASALREAG